MRPPTYTTTFSVLSSIVVLGSAWQSEVHNQIGFMADALLSPNAYYVASVILEPKYGASLGQSAAWADTVSKTSHKYSYGWHWISAKDNPPDDCGLYYHRDCQAGGCVVQQIHNQTQILEKCINRIKQHEYSADVDCQQALMWVTHFVTDVAEPMHTSGRALGGNLFKVKFNGTETNLHQVWDRHILYSQTNHLDGFSAKAIDPYFEGLLHRIKDDTFRQPRSEWAMCDYDARRGTYCPELWAKDSNAIVCDYAYGRYTNDTDLLDSGYAAGAIHIVEQQLAKAAWRLSGWLNELADRVLGFDDASVSSVDEVEIVSSHRKSRNRLNVQDFKVGTNGNEEEL